MTVLLAVALGIGGAGYAAWPLLRGRTLPPLADERGPAAEALGSEAAALWAWSAAAGEIRRLPGGPATPSLDPEEFPK